MAATAMVHVRVDEPVKTQTTETLAAMGAMSSSDFEPVTHATIEAKIFALLVMRQDGATICPSEVARALVPDDGPWRELMPQVRQVAQSLALNNRLKVTRGGVQVDATSHGGPIRLGRLLERDNR